MGEISDLEKAGIEMAADLRAIKGAQERGFVENAKAHKELGRGTTELRMNIASLSDIIADLVSDKKARNIMYTVALVVLSGTGGSIAWAINYVNTVNSHVTEIEQEERANAKYGFELANGLRRDVDRNKKDIDALQEHHTQPKPGSHMYPNRGPSVSPDESK